MNRFERNAPVDRARRRVRGGRGSAAARFLAAWLRREAMALDPACFALVMATCIVSNSFFLQGHPMPSDALLAVGLVAYAWLCLLTAWRATRAGAALWADLLSPRSVFSFFTFVAASDALRSRSTCGASHRLHSSCGWRPSRAGGIDLSRIWRPHVSQYGRGNDPAHGAWLNAIVATQSLVILGVHATANAGSTVSMLLYALWSVGLGLYGIMLRCSASVCFSTILSHPMWVRSCGW